MAREFFCAYHSLLETAQRLNDAEFGRLMRAAISYSAFGESPTLGGRELMMWDMVKWQIDRDKEKYQAFSEKQTENGKKGGRPKKANETQKTHGFSEKPKKAKEREKEKNISANADNTPLTPLEGAIEDFKRHRTKLKKPMTDRAVELFRANLEKLAPGDEAQQIAIINQSIERGWLGTFPIGREKKQGTRRTYEQRTVTDEQFSSMFLDLEK